MNAEEATKLCRMTKAACPQQAIEQETPLMWSMILKDVRFTDAVEAVVNLAGKQPFVAPAEIKTEVKRIRGARITAFGPLPAPPLEVENGERSYRDWQAECQRRIADGEVTDPAQLPTKATGNRAMVGFERVFQQITAGPVEDDPAPSDDDTDVVVEGTVVDSDT